MAFSNRLQIGAAVLCLSLFACTRASGQRVTVYGGVYNRYGTGPLNAVSVMSSQGKGTTTDSNGRYVIVVRPDDSIWFSYLGRSTGHFPVRGINPSLSFDIALQVDPKVLPEARVNAHDYLADSIRNREDYRKYFDYKKPNPWMGFGPTSGGLGITLDITAIIERFQFDKIRRAKHFQKRLIEDEQEKYVDHRYDRSIVLKITHLQGDSLDSFMVQYRPSYEFCVHATDYDLYAYIRLAFLQYLADVRPDPSLPDSARRMPAARPRGF